MQLALLFEESPIPEARVNDACVLLGPALVRQWWPDRNERAAVCFLVRRLGGEYCYATESFAGCCWSGYSTSLKWNRFTDLTACIAAATKEAEKNVRKIMNVTYNNLPKEGAVRLLTAFERGDFVETITGEHDE